MQGPEEAISGEEDVKVIMFSVAIKKLFPDLPLFVQVANSVEKEAIISSVCDRIFCTNELKMSLMARACIAPGATTLLSNIVRSYRTSTPSERPWLFEYCKGPFFTHILCI